MNNVKRGLVVFTVLAFVGTAVWLNHTYDKRVRDAAEPVVTEDAAIPEGSELYYTTSAEPEPEPEAEEVSALTASQREELSAIRLARETARAEAAGALEVIASTEGVDEAALTEAAMKLTQLADRTAKEGELESQIISKGFLDCVVCLSDDHVTVSVACDGGLTGVAVAKITDAVLSETGYTAAQLRVSEVK